MEKGPPMNPLFGFMSQQYSNWGSGNPPLIENKNDEEDKDRIPRDFCHATPQNFKKKSLGPTYDRIKKYKSKPPVVGSTESKNASLPQQHKFAVPKSSKNSNSSSSSNLVVKKKVAKKSSSDSETTSKSSKLKMISKKDLSPSVSPVVVTLVEKNKENKEVNPPIMTPTQIKVEQIKIEPNLSSGTGILPLSDLNVPTVKPSVVLKIKGKTSTTTDGKMKLVVPSPPPPLPLPPPLLPLPDEDSKSSSSSNLIVFHKGDASTDEKTIEKSNPLPPPLKLSPIIIAPPSPPKKKKKKEDNRKIIPLKERQFNPNEHCGVLNADGVRCKRSLTCKTHSMSLRRAVPGRDQAFDALLISHKKIRDEAKLAKQNQFLASQVTSNPQQVANLDISTDSSSQSSSNSTSTTVPHPLPPKIPLKECPPLAPFIPPVPIPTIINLPNSTTITQLPIVENKKQQSVGGGGEKRKLPGKNMILKRKRNKMSHLGMKLSSVPRIEPGFITHTEIIPPEIYEEVDDFRLESEKEAPNKGFLGEKVNLFENKRKTFEDYFLLKMTPIILKRTLKKKIPGSKPEKFARIEPKIEPMPNGELGHFGRGDEWANISNILQEIEPVAKSPHVNMSKKIRFKINYKRKHGLISQSPPEFHIAPSSTPNEFFMEDVEMQENYMRNVLVDSISNSDGAPVAESELNRLLAAQFED